ncbi:DUF11 domain-containing protein [Candidatus Woesearchaeota archaeon]|nr:DUF11 domain-containing protein [Candidatus Woesearchaeota archaeon]
MRKLMLFVLVLILILPAVAAVSFNDWVGDMETFKVGGHYFYVEYISSRNGLIFKMDDIGGIMSLGECETRENVRYCFEEVEYPEVKVSIQSLAPDVSVERTFSTTTPYLDEEVTVTVSLKNDGTQRADNVRYTESYPSSLRVYGGSNTKVWEGNLNAGEEEVFRYKLKAEGITSFDSTATLTYRYNGIEEKKKSSTETINVREPFNIKQEISTEAADKNEVITYNITIINVHDSDDLVVKSLDMDIPQKLDLVAVPSGLGKNGNRLTFEGTIKKGEKKTIQVRVKSAYTGKFTIKTAAELEILGKSFGEELQKEFSVGLSYILPIINVTNSVKSNSPYPVYIAVKNYGKDEIKDVSFNVESSLFSNIEEERDIAAGDTYRIMEMTLTAPYSEEEKRHSIRLYGHYTSPSGRLYQFEKTAALVVEAAPKVVSIIRELNKEEFHRGEEIKVTVRLKNPRNKAVEGIDVSDIFPKEIRSSLLGDVTAEMDDLKPNEEIRAYAYSVVVPKDYKEDEIEFKTVLNARLDGELVILRRDDKVRVLEGKAEEQEEEETPLEEEPEEEEEIVVVEEEVEIKAVKEPFFRRVMGWFMGLFGD